MKTFVFHCEDPLGPIDREMIDFEDNVTMEIVQREFDGWLRKKFNARFWQVRPEERTKNSDAQNPKSGLQN